MDRTDRNILILGILLLVLLAVGYYFLLFSPLRQRFVDASEERAQKEQQLAQLEQQVAELENVRRNAPEIERQILEYSKRIPAEDEIPALIVQVQEVAKQAGVEQFSLAPGGPEPPQNGGSYSRIPITMTFLGDYERMQDFLARVRNMSRLVTVNNVTFCRFPEPLSPDASCDVEIEQPEEGTGAETTQYDQPDSQLEVEIQAEIYVQPSGGAAPEPVSPEATPEGGGVTAPAGGTTGASGGATT